MTVAASTIESPARPLGLICGLMAALIWGAWPVISKLGVGGHLDVYDVTALRFGVAGLVLLPILLRRPPRGAEWGRGLALATGAGAPYILVAIGGLQLAPAGHFGVVAPGTNIVVAILGAWLLLSDRPARQRIAGAAMVLAGILLVGWSSLTAPHEAGAGPQWLGDLMFMAGGVLWAGYTLAARRWAVEPFRAVALVSVLSAAFYLPPYVALAGLRLLEAPLSEVLVQALFQGVLVAVVALVLHTKAVELLGAARAALFPALVPAAAMLLAVPVLGEIPTTLALLGVVVVVAGMLTSMGLRLGR